MAFEYHLPAKDKRGVVEVDALTGAARTASALRVSQVTRMVSRDALFDISAPIPWGCWFRVAAWP